MKFANQSASVGPQWDMANITFDWNKYRLEDPADLNDAAFYWCEGRVGSGGESDGESCPTIAGHTFAEFQKLGQENHGKWSATP